jgi:hypothetical protein
MRAEEAGLSSSGPVDRSGKALACLRSLVENREALAAFAGSIISHAEHRPGTREERETLGDVTREYVYGFFRWVENQTDLAGEREGMLKMDAVGAAYLAAIGAEGQADAAGMREESQALWKKHLDLPPP